MNDIHRLQHWFSSRRGRMVSIAVLIVALAGAAIGVRGWRGDDKSGIPAPTPSTEGPTSMVGRAPLTGLPTAEDLDRPAVTVKISNTPDAHPQRGLADADIVFVEPITGGTTRLAAIFHSKLPAQVGPVRSLRPMDAALIGPTKGIVADTMADRWVLDYVDRVADLDDLGTLRVPADTYRLDDTRQASSVTIGYGGSATANWTYDTASHRWLRAEKWSRHVIENDGQVAADNVIMLTANRDTSFPKAKPTMTILDVFDASGPLKLFTGDKVVTGRWSKGAVNESFKFTTTDGKPMLLAPGTTWVECALTTMPIQTR